MKLIDFEKQILLKYQMEDEFKEFLKNDNLLKLEKTTEIFSGAKDEGDDSCFVEAIVGDYLEEISGLKQFSEEENKKNIRIKNSEERVEKLVVGNTLMVVNIAFDYLVRGISFLDLIQEGNIGLLRALDNCSDKKSISLCMEMWIRREMLLFIKNEMDNEKQMYKHYLLEKISEIETVFEDKDDKKLIDEKEIKAKEKEKKILKEKILWLDSLEYDTLYRKLTKVEEEILKKYYGLIGEKRESIFEIENDLKLERGSGEKSFIEALSKLSSAGGKIIRV